MNPLFMQMMMNMGFGCAPSPFMMGMNFMMPSLFCGCSNFMTMPYYQNDNLGFLNFPVIRNTSADFLLDPNLALKQCQANWQNGGGIFGHSILPGFSFPQISPIAPIGLPSVNPSAAKPSQKTEEERKAQTEAEQKKKDEEAKPAHKTAQKQYELLKSLKKLAEDKTNLIDEIPEELLTKAEEAMKKETADEQLKAMQEVLSAVPSNTLRKVVLANDEVRKKLRRAGYNFDYAQNKYSFKDPDAYVLNIAKLETDIKGKTYDELQKITGDLSKSDNAKAEILSIISAWNNAHKTSSDRGIIRYIASNLPTEEKQAVLLGVAKGRIVALTQALMTKADEYSGYEKIASAREALSKQLESIISDSGFTKQNLNKLADAFDNLYVRLRMQEAVAVRDYVNNEFGFLNEIHEGTIGENTIIEETKKDIEAEGLTPTAVGDLDKAPARQQIQVQERVELRDLNKKYEDDGKTLLEVLDSTYHCVKKVNDPNYSALYQSATALDAENGRVRYFAVSKKDNKIYELYKVTKKEDGKDVTKYLPEKGASPVTAEEIADYDATVKRVNKWYADKVIGHIAFSSRYPIFYATGSASDKYTIKNGKFCRLVGAKKIYLKLDEATKLKKLAVDFNDGRTGVYLDDIDISSNDLEEVTDMNEIKTASQVKEEKEKKEREDVDAVESRQYSSLKDVAESNEEMDKIAEDVKAKITENMPEEKAKKTEVIFRKVKTGVQGYFYCETKNPASVKYYKYDVASGSLEYLEGVKDVTTDGYLVKENGQKVPCVEVLIDKNDNNEEFIKKVQEYGSEFRTLLNGGTSPEQLKKVHKKLNTMRALNQDENIAVETKADYIINFIKGYKNNKCLWSNSGICRQIVTEDDIPVVTGKQYVKIIAEMLKTVVAKTGFDRSTKDYEALCAIADGNIFTDASCNDSGFGSFEKTEYENLKYTAEVLDEIINKIIEAYNIKCGINE